MTIESSTVEDAAGTAPVAEEERLTGADANEVDAADSSNAGTSDANAPTSMLEAVKQALKPAEAEEGEGEGEADSSEAIGEDQGKPEAELSQNDADDPDDSKEQEDFSKLPFHKHPRFKGLLEERNKLRETASQNQEQLAQFKDAAERFTAFQAEVVNAGLTAREIDDAFAIMALRKSDPAAALEKLRPYYDELAQLNGAVLPPDVQQQVDAGYLTPEAAADLVKARSQAQWSQQRLQESQARQLQAQDAQVQESHAATQQAIGLAVSRWDSEWQKADPDYAKKQPFVMSELESRLARLAREGKLPQGTDEAIEIAKDVRKAVEDRLAAVMPRREAKRTVTGGVTASANPRPQSLQDAVRLAARGEYTPHA